MEMYLVLYLMLVGGLCGYYVGKYYTRKRVEKQLLSDIETIARRECRRIVRETEEGREAVNAIALKELERKG
jgi:membrane protein DedA with SNARE-associated domain